MKKNLAILLIFGLLVIGLIVLFGFIFPIVINLFLFNHYFKSIMLLLIFVLVVLKSKLTWEKNVVILVGIFVILGTFMDSAGTPIYNKPLEWILSPFGQVQIDTNIFNYAPGEYSITNKISLIKDGGQVIKLNTVFLYIYRLVQYLVLYSVLATILGTVVKIMDKKQQKFYVKEEAISPELELKIDIEKQRREEEKEKRLILPEEVKESVLELKKAQEIIKAIKLIREHTDLSISEAKKLIEELE